MLIYWQAAPSASGLAVDSTKPQEDKVYLTLVRFHPQAWINDYAIDVDPEGPTDWKAAVPYGMQSNTCESDSLARDENAPQWVQEWSGPFWIEIDPNHDR